MSRSVNNSRDCIGFRDREDEKDELSTRLHWAIEHNKNKTIESLVKSGFDIEAKDSLGRTPLYLAANCGNVFAIQILLEYGAKVEATCNMGITPLQIAAAWSHHNKATKLLIEAGANIEAKDSLGRTPLQIAIDFNNSDAVFDLKKACADLTGKTLDYAD